MVLAPDRYIILPSNNTLHGNRLTVSDSVLFTNTVRLIADFICEMERTP
jgi:hypothetical protein